MKRRDLARAVVIAEVLVLVGLTWSFAWNHACTGDFWVHAAVVRSFAENPFHPAHPLFLVDTPHVFFSPYAFLLGLVARCLGVSAVNLLSVVGGLNIVLFFWALGTFLRRTMGGSWSVLAVTVPMVLFLWGPGAWYWSGFFHFRAIIAVASYPSTVAAAAALACLVAANNILRRRRPVQAIGLAFGIAFVSVTHPTTGVALVIGLVALAGTLLSQSRTTLRDAGLVVVSFGVGFGLVLAWPFLNLWDLILRKTADFNQVNGLLYDHVFERAWPVFLVAPFILLFARKRETAWLAAWWLMLVVSYIAGFFLGAFGAGRVISWFGMLGQIALAYGLTRWASRGRWRVLAGAVVAGVVVLGLWTNQKTLADALPRSNPQPYPTAFLKGIVGPQDVVLADQETSFSVPAFAGKVVATIRSQTGSRDRDQRFADVEEFFGSAVTDDRARAIIEKYQVKFVLVAANRRPQVLLAGRLGTLAARTGFYRLYRVGGT